MLASSILLAAVAQAEETIEVTVTGYGRTALGAHKDALRAAVEEAAGTYVDSDTLIANEEVIYDKVLTYSDGMVKRIVEKSDIIREGSLSVFSDDAGLLIAPTKVSDYSFYIDALSADFNRDGRSDYAVRIWSGGCGLDCGSCDVVFVLSDGNGFRIQLVDTWFSGAEDFIDLKGDGTCLFVHSSYVRGAEAGMDRNVENYWVYNLFSFDGPNLKNANDVVDGFPKWNRFTKSGNHKAATRLSDEQKRRLWECHADILGERTD